MISRLLALTITAALALGVAGSASALNERGGNRTMGPSSFIVTDTWDKTHTYAVNGKKRTCTITRGAKCVGAKLRGKVKHHGDLRNANLRRADLRHADLRGANLQGADLRSANLKNADLRGANLKGAKFHYASPVHGRTKAKRGNQTPSCAPSCEGANLAFTVMYDANLTDANLSYANLFYANLASANLTDANVTRANMVHAWLVYANLTGANLYGSNLTRANLDDANLTDADLGGVTWSNTICPDRTVTSTGCPT